MSFNVGGIDRALRVVLGVGLIALAFFHVFTGTLAIVAYVVAAIALVTGVFRFCPAWALFGIDTSSAKVNR
jgi:hypothetical protein